MFIAGCVCENCGKLLTTKFTTMGKLITFARDSGWSVSNHRQGPDGKRMYTYCDDCRRPGIGRSLGRKK